MTNNLVVYLQSVLLFAIYLQSSHITQSDFWIGPNGESPSPFTAVTTQDLLTNRWLPRDADLTVSRS
jgi:hypothetical protein